MIKCESFLFTFSLKNTFLVNNNWHTHLYRHCVYIRICFC